MKRVILKYGIIFLFTIHIFGQTGQDEVRISAKIGDNVLFVGNSIKFEKKQEFDDILFNEVMPACLEYRDPDDEKHKLALIKKIREYCPEIVIANAPSDRHPDHGRASQIVLDACFLSGLEKVETKQKVWRPKAIYHYIQFNNLKPDLVVDISSQMDKKLEA